MQTPKTRSSELPQRTSPAKTRTSRPLKTAGSDSDSVPSTNPVSRTPKNKSKVVELKACQNAASQKKRSNKMSELESQLAQLQEELKNAKDQLSSSESRKKQAQQEAEEAKKQFAVMSAMFGESQKQLMELSACDDERIQELRKISQERDRAWQSELEAVRKQHSMDSAALASALNEIQKLKIQLERVAESEAAQARYAESAHSEIQNLQVELKETFSLVEELKAQLSDCKETEAQALKAVSETQVQLEMAKTTEETLRSENLKAMEANRSLVVDLEQSKARVNSLEELVSKLQSDLGNNTSKSSLDPSTNTDAVLGNGEHNDSDQLREELNNVKFEVGQLGSALDAAERRYHEQYIQSTLEIKGAQELAEQSKLESSLRESELESNLKKTKADIEKLNVKLMAKETKLQSVLEDNDRLSQKENQPSEKESKLEMEIKKFELDLEHLKAILLDKETELQNITEENKMLKLEMIDRETGLKKANEAALSLAEAARAAEQEALSKLGYLTEEADKSSRRAVQVTEELDAAQTSNSDLETELRRLKVQSDQWRKAADTAIAMLSTGKNAKFVDLSGSLDSNCQTIGGELGSPFSEDMDDESAKKKNNNMLKKIGVLLKKSQK